MLHELLTQDKHLKDMKGEVDVCITECKKILNVLEAQVSKSIINSLSGSNDVTKDGQESQIKLPSSDES